MGKINWKDSYVFELLQQQVKEYNSAYNLIDICIAGQVAPIGVLNDVYSYIGAVSAPVFGIDGVLPNSILWNNGTGGYAWVNTGVMQDLISKANKTEINDVYSSMLRSYDKKLLFLSYVDTTTTGTLPLVENRAWMVTETGNILGIAADKGDILVYRNSILVAESLITGFFNYRFSVLTDLQRSYRETIANAILDISVQNAVYSGGELYSIAVVVNSSTSKSIRIFKTISAVNTEVCNYTITQAIEDDKVETLLIPQYGGSGITAQITVDWSKIQGTFTSLYAPGWSIKVKYINNIPGSLFKGIELNARDISYLSQPKKIYGTDFNKSGYINATTGLIQANASYVYSDFYLCDPNKIITIRNFHGTASVRKVEFADENKIALTSGNFISMNRTARIVSPAETVYVRFCYLKYESGIEKQPVAIVDFGDEFTQRKSNVFAAIEDFTLSNGATKTNGITQIVGDETWKRYCNYNVTTYIEHFKFVASIEVVALSTGSLSVGIGKYTTDTISGSEELRLTETDIEFWRLGTYTGDILEYQFAHGITIGVGTKIILSIQKTTNGAIIKVTDGTTEISQTVEKLNDVNLISGELWSILWGSPYLAVTSGTINVKSISISTDYNTSTSLGIWGDSFIEGSGMISSGLENRYCALIAADIGVLNCPTFGKGGIALTDDWLANFMYENDISRPKYVIIALGTNNANFAVYQELLITAIQILKDNSQIPILVTVTPRPDVAPSTAYADFRVLANAWIRESAGERYIDVAKAVTVEGDESTWKSGYVFSDNIHPNLTASRGIYNRVKMDVPEIFG